jgi:hypothetical protein
MPNMDSKITDRELCLKLAFDGLVQKDDNYTYSSIVDTSSCLLFSLSSRSCVSWPGVAVLTAMIGF